MEENLKMCEALCHIHSHGYEVRHVNEAQCQGYCASQYINCLEKCPCEVTLRKCQ